MDKITDIGKERCLSKKMDLLELFQTADFWFKIAILNDSMELLKECDLNFVLQVKDLMENNMRILTNLFLLNTVVVYVGIKKYCHLAIVWSLMPILTIVIDKLIWLFDLIFLNFYLHIILNNH